MKFQRQMSKAAIVNQNASIHKSIECGFQHGKTVVAIHATASSCIPENFTVRGVPLSFLNAHSLFRE